MSALSDRPSPSPSAGGKHAPRELDHEYDGIREYDNPTPGWWHAIFIASVVFSFIYFAYYHTNPTAATIQQVWQKDLNAKNKRIFGKVGALTGDQETILSMSQSKEFMPIAEGIFKGNCAQCHASDGGGIAGSGVNLTDDHYKNVKTIKDIFTVLAEGANNGAMPGWKNRLSENERVILAAYVVKLRGTTPANPKGPEGDALPPWPAPPTTPTTPANPPAAK